MIWHERDCLCLDCRELRALLQAEGMRPIGQVTHGLAAYVRGVRDVLRDTSPESRGWTLDRPWSLTPHDRLYLKTLGIAP